MIFESQSTKHRIIFDAGVIEFSKGFKPDNRPFHFGQCDTQSEAVQKNARMKAEEIEKAIEETEDFQRRSPGEHGIWRKDERLARERGDAIKVDKRDIFASYSDEKLRAMLAALDVEIPMDAPRDVLLDLMANADKDAGAKKPAKKTK
jgi:hypothetical protein